MKTWCRHIVWYRWGAKNGWYFVRLQQFIDGFAGRWKMCPICGAERPTRANIAAAANRALQDAGDEE